MDLATLLGILVAAALVLGSILMGGSGSYFFQKRKDGVVMTLADRMLFENGDAVLTEQANALLHKIVNILNALTVDIEIVGHTDDRPIQTRRYPSNWELSTARAVCVVRYMIQQCGMAPNLFSTAGYGDSKPRAIWQRIEELKLFSGKSMFQLVFNSQKRSTEEKTACPKVC